MQACKIRRLVTGHNDEGKSMILSDGIATSTLSIQSFAGLTVTDLWETTVSPADNTGNKDNADRPVHLAPARTGTIFRMVEFPPDALWQGNVDAAAAYGEMGAAHAAEGTDDPTMHKTPSVDYAMIVDGEIWAVMDTEERLMKAGDVLVQRGTNHGWSNRSDRNCLMMFVLCGANPV